MLHFYEGFPLLSIPILYLSLLYLVYKQKFSKLWYVIRADHVSQRQSIFWLRGEVSVQTCFTNPVASVQATKKSNSIQPKRRAYHWKNNERQGISSNFTTRIYPICPLALTMHPRACRRQRISPFTDTYWWSFFSQNCYTLQATLTVKLYLKSANFLELVLL